LALLALVVLSGCVPRTIHRLEAPEAEADSGVWNQGWHVRSASAAGVDAEAAYVRSLWDDHTMWVRVTNTSSETVTVDPAAFYTVGFNTMRLLQTRPETGRRSSARDPEAELIEVDRHASRQHARGRTLQGVALASAVVTTVALVADPPETEEEVVEVAYAYEDAALTAEEGQWTIEEAASRQEAGRDYWEEVLRRTTLYPGESVEGIVHLPIDPQARAVLFEIIVGDTRVPFAYVQHNIRP
ncbi:MAG: hypothetical protein AAFQ43_06705, partial [Bacteroidota bacterium]